MIAAASFPQAVSGYAVIFGIVVLVLNQLGLLDRLGLKGKSAADAAAELLISARTIDRLRAERNQAVEKANELARTRSLEPVLEQVAANTAQLAENSRLQGENTKLQAEVLDRLAKHNGSFAHMEESWRLVAEGLKALMGTIADLHNIPLKEKP